MATDVLFTNGIIAVREKSLLKDKLLRMCEGGVDDAVKILSESGFGGLSATQGWEAAVQADAEDIDAFVREYAPTNAEREYLLSKRDYHNAKAFIKAKYLGKEPDNMLAPCGNVAVDILRAAIESGDFSTLPKPLAEAAIKATEYLSSGEAQGALVGAIFDGAYFVNLKKACSKNLVLKRLVAARADMTNLLTCFRLREYEKAKDFLVEGGTLGEEELKAAFGETDGVRKAFAAGPYARFVESLIKSRELGVPATEAENYRDSYDLVYFAERKYELKSSQPFLYYVLRRRAENADVRIIFTGLYGGSGEAEIKRRLRREEVKL